MNLTQPTQSTSLFLQAAWGNDTPRAPIGQVAAGLAHQPDAVSYTHLRAHET